MSMSQRFLSTALWAALVIGMMSIIGASVWSGRRTSVNLAGTSSGQPSETLPVLFPPPKFSLINQDGLPTTDADLAGHAWVAAFIFTQCAGPCPMMSTKMSELQDRIPDRSIKLVSISVDPERDTPAVLKEYAAKFKADTTRWFFLTGEKAAIIKLSADLKLTLPDASDPMLHSTRFVLLDAEGNVRGTYDGKEDDSVARLVDDAKQLTITEKAKLP